jgi:transposase
MGKQQPKGKKSRRSSKKKKTKTKRRDLPLEELKSILDRARTAPLDEQDLEKLTGAVDTLAFLTQELEKKGASIKRLRKLIFGASTEKTSQVVGDDTSPPDAANADKEDHTETSEKVGASSGGGGTSDEGKQKRKKKKKGHGRNGASAYTGAQKVKVPHEMLKPGDPCPACPDGTLYLLSDPSVLVRVTGVAPLDAVVYEKDRLRCNPCGAVFVAASPEGVGTAKYDETAAAMIALLKYGTGMPFNRLERLQQGMGIPLPASTQWDIVKAAADKTAHLYAEIIRQAAQGELLHNDDTTARILDLMGMRREQALAKGELDEKDRTGIFTSGILSVAEEHKLAVFFTGTQHAGENLGDLLAERNKELEAPIQMCDALSRNLPKEIKTIVANCIAHARRKFVDVADSFPDEVEHVLTEIGEVYKIDAVANKQQMSKEERLAYHQELSAPVMEALKEYLEALLEEKKVEPNSGLGEAIGYILGHWEKLTLFLRVPGAPLDNNIVERSLKRVILHRKNSLFYRSENGARVGDTFMTLIYSAEINGKEPFDYLVALLRHADQAAESPANWMPWNYRETLSKQTGTTPESG